MVALIALIAAGCGGSSSSSSSSGESTGAEEAAGGEEANGSEGSGSSEGSSSQEALAAEVTELEKRPTSIGITEPIKGEIPSGKTIAFLECFSPDCTLIGESVKTAAEKVGWKTEVINSGSTPEEVKNAWIEALRRKPDAIVQTGGPEKAFYAEELKEANEAEIPVIGIAEAGPSSQLLASIGNGAESISRISENNAKFIGSKITSGNVVFVNLTGIAGLEAQKMAMEKTLPKTCPECSLEVLEVPPTSLGKDLPQRVASYLQAHPDTSYVYLGVIDMAIGLESALKGTGVEPVPTVTGTNDEAGLEALAKGEAGLEVTGVYADVESGWRAIDALIRNYTGQPIAEDEDSTMPQWLLTSENVPSENPVAMVPDFVEQFTSLWGVK
jgi:ribose transport system substrate-binding protein